jgi:hypothetical protein
MIAPAPEKKPRRSGARGRESRRRSLSRYGERGHREYEGGRDADRYLYGPDNGGHGYVQSYIDGQPYYKMTWNAGGQYSQLDTQPFLPLLTPGQFSMTIGAVRIFVKDSSSVIQN